MLLTEKSEILAPVEEVWRHLSDPAAFVRWNPKVVHMASNAPFAVGQTFETQYRWNGKDSSCLTTVEAVEPGRRLRLLHTDERGERAKPALRTVEDFELTAAPGGTLVRKRVTISGHGMNPLVVALAWLITRFGKRVETDRLKRACESKTESRD